MNIYLALKITDYNIFQIIFIIVSLKFFFYIIGHNIKFSHILLQRLYENCFFNEHVALFRVRNVKVSVFSDLLKLFMFS